MLATRSLGHVSTDAVRQLSTSCMHARIASVVLPIHPLGLVRTKCSPDAYYQVVSKYLVRH